MKKLFFVIALSFISLSVVASSTTPMKTTTKDNKIEVLIVGQKGNLVKVSRAGVDYWVNKNDLNLSSEDYIFLDMLKENKNAANDVFATGKRISDKSVNKTSEDIIFSDIVLSNLQTKAIKK